MKRAMTFHELPHWRPADGSMEGLHALVMAIGRGRTKNHTPPTRHHKLP